MNTAHIFINLIIDVTFLFQLVEVGNLFNIASEIVVVAIFYFFMTRGSNGILNEV